MTGEESKYYKLKRKECEKYEKNLKEEISAKDLLLVLGIITLIGSFFAFVFTFKSR